jgi:hypothetical protein
MRVRNQEADEARRRPPHFVEGSETRAASNAASKLVSFILTFHCFAPIATRRSSCLSKVGSPALEVEIEHSRNGGSFRQRLQRELHASQHRYAKVSRAAARPMQRQHANC